MTKNVKLMRCPHCHNVAPCVWVGYGKDWVLCRHCQRRVRWLEVETKYLLRDESALGEGTQTEASYH